MNSNSFQQRLLGLQDNLLNFAYMLTSNREEAKDLLQDTTLKALDNEEKYIDNIKVGSINSIFYFLHKAAEPFNCLEQDNLA